MLKLLTETYKTEGMLNELKDGQTSSVKPSPKACIQHSTKHHELAEQTNKYKL